MSDLRRLSSSSALAPLPPWAEAAVATFVDVNTLTAPTPVLSAGPQQIVVANPNGDSYALDAAFTAI